MAVKNSSIAIILAISGLACGREATAQMRSFANVIAPPMPASMYSGSDEGEEAPYEAEPMMHGGRGGVGDELPIVFKTDFGKKLQRVNFQRSPQTILAARVKLAAMAREKRLIEAGVLPDPEAKKPGDSKEEPSAEPAGDAPQMPAMPGGLQLPAGMQMPPEAMEMLRRMNQGGEPGLEGDLGGENEGAGAAGGPGTGGATGPGGKPLTPEQRKAKAEAAKKLAKKVEEFRLMVVAGDWAGVGATIKEDGGVDKDAIYSHVLQSLIGGDQALVPDEVLSLSEISPSELNEKTINKLGMLLSMTAQRGSQSSAVAAKIKQGTMHFGGTEPKARKNAATLLVAAGLPIEAQEYLPALAQARESKDPELLNLYSVYFNALSKSKQGKERENAIEQGWRTALEVLALEKVTSDQRAQALAHAMGFLADVPAMEGDAWLKLVFTGEPDLGWRAIETVSNSSRQLRQRNAKPDERLRALIAAKRIGQMLLTTGMASGEGERWRTGLNMLTMLVLEEAETTRRVSQQPQGGGEQDPYGGGYNPYGNRYNQETRPQFIPVEALGQALPEADWLRVIDPGLAAKLELMVASTTASAGDSAGVLGMIRPIVKNDPARAQKLADAIISAWPSYARKGSAAYGGGGGGRRYGGYGGGMYGGYGGGYGGYGGYDGAVPLTRAKQQRNLEQFKRVLGDLAEVGLTKFNPQQLVTAFAASHSDAEAYHLEDIEAVFGPVQSIRQEVLSELVTNMRQRLVSSWRQPQLQQMAGTKRSDKQLSEMVERGYNTAITLANASLRGEGAPWEAQLALGDLHFDKSEFLYGQKVDMPTYTAERNEAFKAYAAAAGQYAAALAAGTAKPSARVYAQWFSAALGASELGQLTRQDNADVDQIAAVARAIGELPGEQAKKHFGLFATECTRAMSGLSPELKPRYVRNAVKVFGDHPDGKDARAMLAYYDDLLREIQLMITVDGGTTVEAGKPFGAQLAVWCTRAVSRESGSFAKYLTNDYYNPMTGQPVQYRDDLEKKLKGVLGEKFEVVSVTFHKSTVQPMGIERAGWEQFPLAYMVLKAKDAATDKLPSVQLDMDFNDGQGMVILPVVSPPVLIDAKGTAGVKPGALTGMQIEQILDDRPPAQTQASGGQAASPVRIEVRAKAKGLLPAIDQLLDLGTLTGVKLDRVEDQGLNITDLDTSTSEVVPVSERVWTLHVTPTPAGKGEAMVSFAKSKSPDAKITLKRYADADIADVGPSVALAKGAIPSKGWTSMAVGGVAVIIAIAAGLWFALRKKTAVIAKPPLVVMPVKLTPFSAVAVLRKIESLNGRVLNIDQQRELTGVIKSLEEKYFGPAAASADTGNASDDQQLRQVVQGWVSRAEKQAAVSS